MSSSQRRVVHVTSVHPPFDGRIFEKQCKSLAKADMAVSLVAPHDGDTHVDGVDVLGIDRGAGRLQRVFGTARRAMRLAASQKADVYHLHDPELLLWVPLLRTGRSKVIFDMHENLVVGIGEKPYIASWLLRSVTAVARVAQRVLLAGLPVVFAEDSYEAHYRWVKRSIVIRNFPVVTSFTKIRPAKHELPTATYVGAVSPDRGVEVTLHALDILKRRGTTIGFECIGGFDSVVERNRIEQMAVDLGLERTCFHGYRRLEEAAALVARCHVGLAVLASRPNLRDSFPTKIFDYVALGLPVIASDFPLYRSLVEDLRCGAVVDPSQADLLADAIEQTLASTTDQDLAESSARLTANYDWEQTEAVRLVDFYDTVMGR